MINSYNVISGKVSINEIIQSGIGLFSHRPGSDDEYEAIQFMILYFTKLEMYEKCSVLKKYIEDTFNEDGSHKEIFCNCDMPDIHSYIPKVTCSICNKTING